MHVRLKKKIMLLCCVILVGWTTITAYALSTSNPLSMTKYTQKYSNWCWAACAQMSGNYFGSSYTQSQIVKEIKGSSVNEAASDREMTLALQYVTLSTGYTASLYGVPVFSVIKRQIVNKHYPVVAKISWDSGGAHAEMITGTISSSKKVYLVDPNASNQWVSYSSLKSGVTLNSGTGQISATWRFSD